MKRQILPAIVALFLSQLSAPAVEPEKKGEDLVNQTEKNADQYQLCLSQLKSAGVQFVKLDAHVQDGCIVEDAVELDAIASKFGTIELTGKPALACSFAVELSAWAGGVAAPLTLAYTGLHLKAIETGPGVVCRKRNKNPDEKISEHAKGNAIDLASFILENGDRISIKAPAYDNKPQVELMNALRVTGCGYFTTVLGPGADASHEEHLHFDYGFHGKTDNYRICE